MGAFFINIIINYFYQKNVINTKLCYHLTKGGYKIMKKIAFLLVFGIFLVTIGSPSTTATATVLNEYPTPKEIKQLNEELQILVEQANERLENGERNLEVYSGNLKLGFIENSPIQVYSSSSIGSKSYQAYVGNTNGFNFRHAVFGTFTWNNKLVKAITADEDLTGPMYSKSATTKIQGVDGSIGKDAKIGSVTSKGTFTGLKGLLKSYYTTLVIEFYAPTKSYRIITAKINN